LCGFSLELNRNQAASPSRPPGGDPTNDYADYFDKAAAVFKDSLYIGTWNKDTGGQIWMQQHQVNLPLSVNTFPVYGCATRPTLISPADGSQLDNLIPLYKWDNGQDPLADAARLYIASDPGFNNVVSIWWLGSGQGSYELRDVENLEPATTYYWRTYLMCGEAQGPYSDTWSFRTGSGGVILPAPDLIAPPDGSTPGSTDVTLQWSAVSGSLDYDVWVFNTQELWYWVPTVSETQLNAWLDPNTRYEWWVHARNDYAYGQDSAVWEFTTPNEAGTASKSSFSRPFAQKIGENGEIYRLQVTGK